MKSLDPRVNRLPKIAVPAASSPKAPLDQFGTFEVFVQPKEGKPFQHEGSVHAPNLEMGYVLAKENFTRRFTCTSLYVADTRNIFVSPVTNGNQNAYDLITAVSNEKGILCDYIIFHLLRRGKQHVEAGRVQAASPQEAMYKAKQSLNESKIIYNIWALCTNDIRFTQPEEKDLWVALPEKKFRDAADYKGGDKLKSFLQQRSSQ